MPTIFIKEAVSSGLVRSSSFLILLILTTSAIGAQEGHSVMLMQKQTDTLELEHFLLNFSTVSKHKENRTNLGISSKVKQAFFCELEDRGAKKARIPMKFRLGDIDYVDWREGKRSSIYGLKPIEIDR